MTQPLRDDPQIKFRLPKGLHRQIKVAAAENNRSMNAEVISRLEASFQAADKTSDDPLLDALLAGVIDRIIENRPFRRWIIELCEPRALARQDVLYSLAVAVDGAIMRGEDPASLLETNDSETRRQTG